MNDRTDDLSAVQLLTLVVMPQLSQIDKKQDAMNDRMNTLERTFVTRDEKHKLENDIAALRLESEAAKADREDIRDMKVDVSDLKTWRNRFAGAIAVIAVALVPLAAVVLSHIKHF